MVQFSPQVCLTLALMSSLLGAFCVWYLWDYKRFRCLKYDGTKSGRFRFMIRYLYISSVLTLMAFSIGLATVKYKEGLAVVGVEGTFVPNPVESWSPAHRRAFFALVILFSFSWAFEIIVHLGELCRWLFLFSGMTCEELWLKSKYMHAWIIGSVVVALYMPVVAGIGCNDMMRCQARTFVVGSFGSLVPTLGFIPMLVRFPAYILEMERRSADQPTLMGLVKFQALNRVRLVFRLTFISSFLLLGLDWTQNDHPLTVNPFWADTIGFIGIIAYVSSSALTLPICFPQLTYLQPNSPTHTTEKWTTDQTAASSATCPNTSISCGGMLEIGPSFPVYEPALGPSCTSSSLATVEVAQLPKPHTIIPMIEPPPMV